MKTCVILNPNAGSATDIDGLRQQLQRLDSAELCMTAQPSDAEKVAHEALEGGCQLVVAVGGDGTINEVVNGLSADFGRVTLGIIPWGTGNDFARSIGVPADLAAAVDALVAAETRAIDVLRVTNDKTRYSVNVSSGGFSGKVDEALDADMKQSWGSLAYLRSAAATLPSLADYHARITLDGAEHLALDAYNIVVANARYVAGGIPIAPEAELDDGRADLIVVPSASLPQLAILVPRILLGHHLDSDLVLVRRARRISIRSEPAMPFNVDGELVGETPITFEVLPRALRVIVGPAAQAQEGGSS